MNGEPLNLSSSSSVHSRLSYVTSLIVVLVTLTLAEITARSMTYTLPNGLKMFRGVALLPYRPDEALVREAVKNFRTDSLLIRDPEIGWIVRPNRAASGDYTNAQGIRATPGHLYTPDPPEGKVRIVTLGDSFVYCLQVKNGETWQDYMEEIRNDVELLNLGIPGGGTDQAFLRWKRDGSRFKPQIAILGIWPGNVFRNLNIIEYYRTEVSIPLTKPRLIPERGATDFVNFPIMSEEGLVDTLAHPERNPVLRYEFWYNSRDAALTPFRTIRLIQVAETIWRHHERQQVNRKILSGEIPDGLDVTVTIAKLFANEVRDAGAVPLVLIIPDRQRLDLGGKSFPLAARLKNAGIDVIDMGPTFGNEVKKEGPAKYYVDGVGHNSPFGNKVFASYLERELRPWIEKAKASSGRVRNAAVAENINVAAVSR
jgi:hypothetical protein